MTELRVMGPSGCGESKDDDYLYTVEDTRSSFSDREEDYLLAILESLGTEGYARNRDISNRIGVRPASAVEMVRKLDRKKLVVYKRYRGVALTAMGQCIAMAVRKRRTTSVKFLELLLVPREIALKDAHILEHQLDTKTILQIERFVEFTTFTKSWKETFKAYCGKGGAENGFIIDNH